MSEEWTNFYAGNTLNRLSWLRPSSSFLRVAISKQDSRFIVFQNNLVLATVDGASADKVTALGLLHTSTVQSLFPAGSLTFGSHAGGGVQDEGADAPYGGSRASPGGPILAFLGVEQYKERTAPTDFIGIPYFAIDIGGSAAGASSATGVDAALAAAGAAAGGKVFKFVDPRAATPVFGQKESSLFSEARSIIDWNVRNKYCPGCGLQQYSLWGGWKLACTSILLEKKGEACPSVTGLHNFHFPRTDPVIIIAVLNEAGDKILLGRGKRFPPNLYSTIGGFVEHGESFEDAVKRELLEECGVRVRDIRYHSSQPWPYPANLMVGYICTASEGDPIKLEDKELADARWHTRAEVQAVLAHSGGALIAKRENPFFEGNDDGEGEGEEVGAPEAAVAPTGAPGAGAGAGAGSPGQPAFRVPPRTAVGGVMISDWAYQRGAFR